MMDRQPASDTTRDTEDSIMLAVKAERAVIAEYIISCREGGRHTRTVQVFDVLAQHILEGKHYPLLPDAPPLPPGETSADQCSCWLGRPVASPGRDTGRT